MKKLFSVIFFVFLASMPVHAAKSVKVSAVSDFSTLKPTPTMQVIVLEDTEFDNGIMFKNGTLLYGEVYDVKQPTRGKRNATFKFKPVSYTYLGKTTQITDNEFYAKYAPLREIDKGKIATSAATTAGGLLLNVPLLSQGVSLVKGIWKNKEDNRLKSGVVQVYKDSPLSYIEEGNDVELKEDAVFVFKFKCSNLDDLDATEENDPNLEYVHPVNTTSTSSQETLNSFSQTFTVDHPEDVLKEVEEKTKTAK